MQRADGVAPGDSGVGGLGGGVGRFGAEFQIGAQLRLEPGDARVERIQQLHRRHLPAAEHRPQFHRRPESQFIAHQQQPSCVGDNGMGGQVALARLAPDYSGRGRKMVSGFCLESFKPGIHVVILILAIRSVRRGLLRNVPASSRRFHKIGMAEHP